MKQIAVLHRQLGVTLIEAMVTVSIAAILVAAAAPSFTNLVRKFKLNSISTSIAASLQLARSEAIKSNRRVLVCARNNNGTDCTASTNWGGSGWLVCYDQDANGACDAATASLPNPIRLDGAVDSTFASVTGPSAPVSFNSIGHQGGASPTTVTISTRGTWAGAKDVTTTIAATGLVKTTKL